jgi:hypothetical protein
MVMVGTGKAGGDREWVKETEKMPEAQPDGAPRGQNQDNGKAERCSSVRSDKARG